MAVEQTQILPAPVLEGALTAFTKKLEPLMGQTIDTSKYAPQVAAQTALQTGASQAAQGLAGIGQQAAMSGNLGGGREGVMRAQYQNKSDMNRALLQSGLLQQGFTQANQLANQAFGQQMALGQNQQGLAAQVPGLYGQDISTLGSAGAGQQAQTQAVLDATRERNRLRAYEPYERLGFQQTGVASIASGAPGQYQSMVTPNPTPLQNALGIASVGGGLLGNYGDYLKGGGTKFF